MTDVAASDHPAIGSNSSLKEGGGLYGRVPIAAIFDPEVAEGELRTLAVICAYMRPDNFAWPSQALMGLGSIRSRSTINRHVRKLERRGHITVHRYRHADGSMRCTYRVNFTPRHLPQWPGKSRP
jgi:hypothetical protein